MTDIFSFLAGIRRYAQDNRVPILAAASEQILVRVVLERKPERILEIGTAVGFSALLMAAHMPPAGHIITIEQDINRIAVARQFISQAEMDHRIKVMEGDAAQIIPQLKLSFDLVFVDAAKAQYYNYLMLFLPQLSSHSVIVADNVLFRGMVFSGHNPPRRFRTIVVRMKKYLDFVTSDPRFRTEICAVGDGMAISYYQGDPIT